MRTIGRSGLLAASASVLALMAMSPAMAQATAPPADNAGAAAGPAQVSEVVVTAQKRSEALTKVPISITAANAQQLKAADINDVAGLQKIVPGFSLTFAGAEAQPPIHGVGTQVAGPGLPPNVAIYQDGFYQPNAIVNNVQFPDIASVQVLKGPQGELYGQNATGGAVLVTTRDPTAHPTADMDVSYRSYNDARLGVFVAGPIVPTLTGSLSVYAARADDYNTNVYTGSKADPSHTIGVHAKLLWQPTNWLSFLLSGEYVDFKDPNTYVNGVYKDWANYALPPYNGVVTDKPYDFSYNYPSMFRAKVYDLGLKTTVDLPFGTLTSLSHGQWARNLSVFDIDGTSAPESVTLFPGVVNNASQELDLVSNQGGPVQWLLGGIYFHDDDSDSFTVLEPIVTKALAGGVVINSEAIYGDVTYNLLEHLYVTAGLRYSHDELKEHYDSPLLGDGDIQHYASTAFDKLIPRAVLRYDVTDNSNVYFSYSTGYKSGGFNPNGLSPAPVKPETITAYEVGYKQAGHGYHLELAGFYYDYSNLQVNQYLSSITLLLNAAKAKIYGAELSGSFDFWDNFTLSGGMTYVHARYSDFNNAPKYQWCAPTATPCTVVPEGGAAESFPAGVMIYSADATNNPLSNSPDFSAKFDLTYRHELPVGKAVLDANVSYQTQIYFDAFEQLKQPGYALVNLRASWISPDNRYTVSVFCDNVADQAYINEAFSQNVVFSQHWGPPRVVGAELKIHL